jgi:hypothetical protein
VFGEVQVMFTIRDVGGVALLLAGIATWNAAVHVLMLVGMFVLLRVPVLEHWVDHHVMGRRTSGWCRRAVPALGAAQSIALIRTTRTDPRTLTAPART